jgi:cysteine desulfurase
MIRANSALVTIMYANNETGYLNDIKTLTEVAHKNKLPIHTDAVQAFGKIKINPIKVDALSLSFHKSFGPPGTGALVVHKKWESSWNMRPMIAGSQNEGMRGGTENMISISGSFKALQVTSEKFIIKQERSAEAVKGIVTGLCGKFDCVTWSDYLKAGCKFPTAFQKTSPAYIVFIGYPIPKMSLPNTLLFAVIPKKNSPNLCNVKIRELLEIKGVYLSIGSACNTGNSKASHVIDKLGADDKIKKGTLRISTGIDTTPADVSRFLDIFYATVLELS